MCKKRLLPIHPGEILREEFMKPLNLSANALAQRLGVTTARVNEMQTNGVASRPIPLCDWRGAFPRRLSSG